LWLSDRLGRNRILDARVILPSDEFFPDPYQPDEPVPVSVSTASADT
jgi:hypothetical protein